MAAILELWRPSWPPFCDVIKAKEGPVLLIMSKEYPALLKRSTIRLKRLEKFGFPMFSYIYIPNLHKVLDYKYLVA